MLLYWWWLCQFRCYCCGGGCVSLGVIVVVVVVSVRCYCCGGGCVSLGVTVVVVVLQLVDHTVRQQRAGRIWGCRHQLEGRQTCFAFHNRRASFLSERYEPITQRVSRIWPIKN